MREYDKAGFNKIRLTLPSIDWVKIFKDISPNQMVEIFHTKFLEIMNYCIPNKNVTINESDAPWVTPDIKTALRKNKQI